MYTLTALFSEASVPRSMESELARNAYHSAAKATALVVDLALRARRGIERSLANIVASSSLLGHNVQDENSEVQGAPSRFLTQTRNPSQQHAVLAWEGRRSAFVGPQACLVTLVVT